MTVFQSRIPAGPRITSVSAIATLLPNASLMGVARLFLSNLTPTTTAAAIVESAVAALAGAAG